MPGLKYNVRHAKSWHSPVWVGSESRSLRKIWKMRVMGNGHTGEWDYGASNGPGEWPKRLRARRTWSRVYIGRSARYFAVLCVHGVVELNSSRLSDMYKILLLSVILLAFIFILLWPGTLMVLHTVDNILRLNRVPDRTGCPCALWISSLFLSF
jgi:hypothetical protein